MFSGMFDNSYVLRVASERVPTSGVKEGKWDITISISIYFI